MSPVRNASIGMWRSRTAPKTPSSKRSYSSRIRGGTGSRSRMRRPKLRIVNRPTAATTTTTMPTTKTSRTAGGNPLAEAPEAGRQAEDGDREDVEDPLDEDGPEGPAERRHAVHLEQVGAVDVTELGRDDAVDEPRDVQDLGRVPHPDDETRLAQEPLPAVAAQREPEIEHDEREEDERRVRLEDQLRGPRPGALD